MMNRIYGEYLDDFKSIKQLAEIPENVAVFWVQSSEICEMLKLNLRPYYDKYGLKNWMNKGWYRVEEETILYNHDGRFYIYFAE